MPFVYQPLPLGSHNIRVLKVQPDSPHTKIRCTLEDQSINEEYHCLSCVWGDPEPRKNILLNGEEFEVGPNLWRFLNAARRYGFSGKIWIDAICLNQENIMELSHEVSRMGEIYSSASSVLLWLDLTDEEVATLCKVQNLLLHGDMNIESRRDDPTELWSADRRRQCFKRDEFQNLRGPYDRIRQELRSKGVDLSNSTEFRENFLKRYDTKDIQQFFLRPYAQQLSSKVEGICYLVGHPVIEKVHISPYWTRIWIVQELVLARRVQMLGPSNFVDFLVIEPFLQWCNTTGDAYTYPRMTLEQESKNERYDPNDFSLMLTINEHRQCSRKRDRLYAMLSMTTDDHNVKVDYTASDMEVLLSVFSYQWYKHKDKLTRGVDLDEKMKDKFRHEYPVLGTLAVRFNEFLQPLVWKMQIIEAIVMIQEMTDVLIGLQFSLDLAPWQRKNVCHMSNLRQHIEQQPNCAYWCDDVFDMGQIKTGLINIDMAESASELHDVCGICIPVPEYENELVVVLLTTSYTTDPTNGFLIPGAGKVLQWRSGRWRTLNDHSIKPLKGGKSRR